MLGEYSNEHINSTLHLDPLNWFIYVAYFRIYISSSVKIYKRWSLFITKAAYLKDLLPYDFQNAIFQDLTLVSLFPVSSRMSFPILSPFCFFVPVQALFAYINHSIYKCVWKMTST